MQVNPAIAPFTYNAVRLWQGLDPINVYPVGLYLYMIIHLVVAHVWQGWLEDDHPTIARQIGWLFWAVKGYLLVLWFFHIAYFWSSFIQTYMAWAVVFVSTWWFGGWMAPLTAPGKDKRRQDYIVV